MKIKVFQIEGENQDHMPYRKTKRIIEELESSSKFEKSVIKIRKQFGIPQSGIKLSKTTSSDLSAEIKELMEYKSMDFKASCEEMLSKYNLPEYWNIPLYYIVLFNVVIPPMRKPITFYYDEDEAFELETNQYRFGLVIGEYLAKSEFINEMKK